MPKAPPRSPAPTISSLKAKQIMTSPCVCVRADTPMKDVAKLMREKDIGAVIVADSQGMLKGIISESDVVGVGRCVPFALEPAPMILGARVGTLEQLVEAYSAGASVRADQVMSAKVTTVGEEADAGHVAHILLQRNLKHIPVVKEGKAVGIIARHDVLKHMTGMK